MGWQEDQNPKTQAAARKALGEDELLPAPTPREGWSSEGLKELETSQLGNPPQGYQVTSKAPGVWDVEWEDGHTERLREGDRSTRYPDHEVTGFPLEPNPKYPQFNDQTLELTPPYGSGNDPYVLRTTAGRGMGGSTGSDQSQGNGTPDGKKLGVPSEGPTVPRLSSVDSRQGIIDAGQHQGWGEPTTRAVLSALMVAERMAIDGFNLLHTSENHTDGAPDNIYFEDNDGKTWEAAHDPDSPMTPYVLSPASTEDAVLASILNEP